MKLLKTFAGLLAAITLIAAPAFASNEIRVHDPSGRTVYAVIGNSLQSGAATVWTGSSFAALTTSNQTSAALSIPEASTGTGYYVCSFPAGITAPGRYPVTVYEQQSSTAAPPTDVIIATGTIDWGGTAAIGTSDVNTTTLSTNALAGTTNALAGTINTQTNATNQQANNAASLSTYGAAIGTQVAGVGTTAAAIKAKTDLVATNGMDSPNALAAQAGITTIGSGVSAIQANFTTILARISQVVLFDGSGNVKANAQVLPTTAPTGYGGSTGGAPIVHR